MAVMFGSGEKVDFHGRFRGLPGRVQSPPRAQIGVSLGVMACAAGEHSSQMAPVVWQRRLPLSYCAVLIILVFVP